MIIGYYVPERAIFAIAALLITVIYLGLPVMIAVVREHPEWKLIAKLTPFTLLSFILWAGLIAWAWTGQRDDAAVSRYVARLRATSHLPVAIAVLVILGIAVSAVRLLL